uniref:L,D-transpeptidase n=1 Tax=uncultured Thiodictyon sp. TaxID=1846217 RepID=UPI0025E03848
MATTPTPDPVSPALITTLGPSARRRRLRIGARVALAAPLLVALGACTQMANFVAKPEPRPKDAAAAGPQVAAKPAAPAEVEPGPIPQPQEKPKPGKLYEWDGGDRKLTRIIVNTDEQKARFYVGDEQVGWTTVASGLSSHPTPVGHFEVLEKSANKRSNLYGKVVGKGGRVLSSNAKAGRDQFPSGARFEGASMPYYLRITYDGVGLHAGPIPRPGHPASHGCIRLPAKLAPVLFEHVGVGTQVSVVGSGPDYGNYAAKQRAYAAERLAKAQERKEVEARVRAQTTAASDATAPAPGPAEPVIAMAEPAERPAASPIAKPEPAAAPRPEPASRTLETPRERAPAATPRRTAEATVSRPRPAATRVRPARA